ncbi:hypothetical protein HNR23_002290 [Nocardiopsis mwathae]|uniref:Uncharacterized protein n=1 Tax=Nocardiopsis mwathae TaxID=1472723 RepID=A0A7W9YHU5_9ACTN|nr:hypothetical protein [Nocardiopsis mwathae]MBB6172230.1 hypothetical protein [Nocardiopsis mwathae]
MTTDNTEQARRLDDYTEAVLDACADLGRDLEITRADRWFVIGPAMDQRQDPAEVALVLHERELTRKTTRMIPAGFRHHTRASSPGATPAKEGTDER